MTNIEAKVLTESTFLEILNDQSITFFGDGASKFKSVINHPNAFFVEGVQPEAKNLGYLAYEKYLKNDFENVETFEPMYLKEFMIKKKII